MPAIEIADLARAERRHWRGLGQPHTDLFGVVRVSQLHVAKTSAAAQHAVEHAHRADHPAVRVVVRVEDQRLERRVGIALGRRDALDDRVEQRLHTFTGLGRDAQRLVGGQAEHLFELGGTTLGLGRGQVDLVEHGHDREVVLEGLVTVRERLGLDALARVHEQHHAFARRERTADLVAEVDVARRVDQVDHVIAPLDAHVLGLDRDATLALEIHRVEVLRAHVARVHRPGDLEQAVGQRALAVIDVGDDREIADAIERGHEPAWGGERNAQGTASRSVDL